MKIYVAGDSHLAHYTKIGAAFRGINITNDDNDADLILIAQDTLTNGDGSRDTALIDFLLKCYLLSEKPVILMSQVPPGFCRKYNSDNLYHYPETLRIKDAYERACNPEYIIIGWKEQMELNLDWRVSQYVDAFKCPVFYLTYEDAEISKIAVNTMLAVQVEYANRMEAACKKVGANWGNVTEAIRHDKRMGFYSYLTPGRWQDSIHLLRDAKTLEEIEHE